MYQLTTFNIRQIYKVVVPNHNNILYYNRVINLLFLGFAFLKSYTIKH